jgi:hypothetical protein
MLRGVEQEVVDVDNDVEEAGDDGLHEALERCRTFQKSHRRRGQLKLSQAGNGESCVMPGFRLEEHLPESGSQIDGEENCTSRPANFANTLTHILH